MHERHVKRSLTVNYRDRMVGKPTCERAVSVRRQRCSAWGDFHILPQLFFDKNMSSAYDICLHLHACRQTDSLPVARSE